RLSNLGKDLGQPAFVQRGAQRLEHGLVPLSALHLDGAIQQVPRLEVVDHQIEKVYMFNSEARFRPGNMIEQKLDVFTDTQFLLGRIVEDVEPDFITQAAAAQQFVGDQLRQDAVQTFCETVAHVPAVMQRWTYSSLFRSRY